MAAPLLKKPIKLALIQLAAGPDKPTNLARTRIKIEQAASCGASLIILPECFNSPYGTSFFSTYAETLLPSPPTTVQSPTFHFLSSLALSTRTTIIGGSIPERDPHSPTTLYNTSLTFSPTGALLATHRKVHLFDINIPKRITFRESDALTPGNKITLVDLPDGTARIAIAICYDIRFPEMATIAARHGAALLVYPGAFNLTTGQLHWELQARARAMDNQVYVALCSPARDLAAEYHAWGHSMVVDPNATVLAEAAEGEEIVYATLQPGVIEETRRNIPVGSQRRFDVYPDVSADREKLRFDESDGRLDRGSGS